MFNFQCFFSLACKYLLNFMLPQASGNRLIYTDYYWRMWFFCFFCLLIRLVCQSQFDLIRVWKLREKVQRFSGRTFPNEFKRRLARKRVSWLLGHWVWSMASFPVVRSVSFAWIKMEVRPKPQMWLERRPFRGQQDESPQSVILSGAVLLSKDPTDFNILPFQK